MSKLFISHSSQDDAFVRQLRAALADHGQSGWIDSRELRGGDPLWLEIQQAIEASAAYAVVVSSDSLQSKWVGKELRHALTIREQRGEEAFPVIPLSLDSTKLGVLEEFFVEEPVYIPVSSGAGGVEAAIHPILVALGKRLPTDAPPTPQPKAEPVEELLLELSDLKLREQDGVRQPSARARLICQPAASGEREVTSAEAWRFVAPIGPIEADELRWYLEKYAVWPSHYFADRARKVEQSLVKWGQLLHQASMPVAQTANVMGAWMKRDEHAGRRFSIYVDPAEETGATEDELRAAKEAATLLLALPWELLHDGDSYLFQGAKPTRVRRRLPNSKVLDVPVVSGPIRILLVTARPEDDACSYIDHRATALPLVEAMETLPGLVTLRVLDPPTLPALREELDRARRAKQPYHVVHFDGHGVYDRSVGLGGLCFELPEDVGKLDKRRHVTVYTDELGPLLRDHRIPLVFLEGCRTAHSEQASESVASALLKVGVASVVAMSHSVLVETSRRFVEYFYKALADGRRVGDAMLAGQRALKDNSFRGRIFGAGELRLEDWFVPVLLQEEEDPQLFTTIPSQQTREDFQTALKARLGDLPPSPETGFIGRSREMLGLQRLLRTERYAVVCGQGGEGKTALAAEFARWMVRSQQIHRVAFVSVELNSHAAAVLDALGRQLVGKEYSVAAFPALEEAILPVERELAERPTLLVIDNMESILLPPFMHEETPEALSEEAAREAEAILALCAHLNSKGRTRVVFTSREALPAPCDAQRNRRELHQLDREDALKLVERVFNAAGQDVGSATDATREDIERLVDAVHCHARTLALLAPALRERGVEATRTSLEKLMADMERHFRGSRELSLFASVELSLQRLSPGSRERVRVLGVFHGAVDLRFLRAMMGWEEADVDQLASELVATGLARQDLHKHLALNPALCHYMRPMLDKAERAALTARWVDAMREFVEFLHVEQRRGGTLARSLSSSSELQNFIALLDFLQRGGDPEATAVIASSLYSLLQFSGKPWLLEHLERIRDAAGLEHDDGWDGVRFGAARNRVEQQITESRVREALVSAQALHRRAQAVGDNAYAGADYDLALASFLLARSLKTAGASEQALPLLEDAQHRFKAVGQRRSGTPAAIMVATCINERGGCLLQLGQLKESAAAYEEAIQLHKKAGTDRDVAVCETQLGTVRLMERRYPEALAAFVEARERFARLNEPAAVATSWHQMGRVYQEAKEAEAAEDAYRESLAIKVRLGDEAGQASTLNNLGILYRDILDRPDEAVTLFEHAAEKYAGVGNRAMESSSRTNLATTLWILNRLDEARQEANQAIDSKASLGHEVEPWKSWGLLAEIETDSGNDKAAAAARAKAIDCYLAYRHDGGENHDEVGDVALVVSQALLAGHARDVNSVLRELGADSGSAEVPPFIQALRAIAAGSRDRSLAHSPRLDYLEAAEILLLLTTLENRDKGGDTTH